MSSMISIEGMSKYFQAPHGSLTVLSNFSLRIENGEFVCILGYSGCGKSTLLRVVAGLETADAGKIIIDGREHNKSNPEVIMLFQDFNQLFPWKTVLQNVAYPLRATGLVKNRKTSEKVAMASIEQVGLADFKNSYPHQLSGGMKQRAAVARALVLSPKVLLMDEPFAALDSITRTSLQNLTRQICTDYGITVLFVTHSVEEAVILADRIVILSSAKHGIDRIIDNRDRGGSDKEKRVQRIAEIIEILNNQS